MVLEINMTPLARLTGLVVLLLAAQLASGMYFHFELERLAAVEPIPVQQDSPTRELIVELIQEQVDADRRKSAKRALSLLNDQYLLAPTNTDGGLMYGDSKARFTLQMYSDIECPYCKQMHPNMKKVVDYSKGVINWEFKHFPLSRHNPAAAVEAQAIECIAESHGNRTAWIALDRFMAVTQSNGQGLGQDFPEFVRSFGLNGNMISNCLASDSHKVKINGDYALGQKLGVASTPAIVLIDHKTNSHRLIPGYKTAEQILAVIQTAL